MEWEHGEQARVTREFCASIGVTEVKFHDLRATFITNLFAGVDVQGATEKLGYTLPSEVSDGRALSIVRDHG